MKSVTKVTFLDEQGEKFFGEGPARLLRAVERHGSLRAAAISMEMAYTKALKLTKQAEAALGYPLITRTTGGKDGGGSTLTPEGKRWLLRYEAYRDACVKSNQALYRHFFPKIGCVIMASGLGKRFGSNKLMADFRGAPMIQRVLDATKGLSSQRVVVTRHEAVADLCRAQGIAVVFHDLPHRSDTVRLGLEAMADLDGCMFLPGDQPLLRRETVAFCAEHGLPIYCEKPLAESLRTAQELVTLAGDLPTAMAFEYRCSPAVNLMKENLHLIGDLLDFKAYFLHDSYLLPRPKVWRMTAENGGGALLVGHYVDDIGFFLCGCHCGQGNGTK